jgi:hypothetical protein
MRALCDNDIPPMSDDDLEATVQARLERQRLLVECPSTTFDFIVEESVFMRRLGGVEVTRDLIDHILVTVAPRNVTLQIMPADAEFHACMAGPIQLLETPDGTWRGYSEGQENGRLITDPKQVSRLHARYARLRSQALPPNDLARQFARCHDHQGVRAAHSAPGCRGVFVVAGQRSGQVDQRHSAPRIRRRLLRLGCRIDGIFDLGRRKPTQCRDEHRLPGAVRPKEGDPQRACVCLGQTRCQASSTRVSVEDLLRLCTQREYEGVRPPVSHARSHLHLRSWIQSRSRSAQ